MNPRIVMVGVLALVVAGGLVWWATVEVPGAPGASGDDAASPGRSVPRASAPSAPSAPSSPEGPSAAPAPAEGTTRAAEERDAAPAAADACDDLDALGPLAMDGALGPEQIRCLEGQLADGSDREVDLLTLLAVQAWTTDREAWARYSLQLASIDPNPDLHHKLALHYRRDNGAAALHHIAVAREQADRWPETRRAKSMERLDVLEAAVCEAEPDLVDCPP